MEIKQAIEKRTSIRVYKQEPLPLEDLKEMVRLASLAPKVVMPPRRDGIRQAFHTYVVQVEERERLISYLAERDVGTKIHYPIPVHLMEAGKGLGYRQGDFPVAESQAQRIISLPVHQHLKEEQISYVIDCVRRFYRG